MTLTTEQKDSFRRDGFLVVPDIFDAATMQAALAECDQVYYGRPFEEVLKEHDSGGMTAELMSGLRTAKGRIQYPCGVPALDRLLENETYLDAFAACLGSDDISYSNSHLFVRSGLNDVRHPAYHMDNDTNTFLPPHPDNTRYEYVNSWVFLHDVGEDGAPLYVIPGSHLVMPEILPRLTREGIFLPRANFTDVSQVPEFGEPIAVPGKAGSALFYSSYLVHSAVPFNNPRLQRAVWTMSLARTDSASYTKYSNVWQYAERDYSIPFLTQTTPRVRAIFGWPRPGDSYYTEETLELLEQWFPGIDLAPYREARAA